jgi:hypothetical protein
MNGLESLVFVQHPSGQHGDRSQERNAGPVKHQAGNSPQRYAGIGNQKDNGGK